MKVCSVETCDRTTTRGQSLCPGHQSRRRATGGFRPDEPIRTYGNGEPCAFSECRMQSKVRGLCRAHYQQQRHGKPLKPLRPRGPNGDINGYRRIWTKDGVVGEHRFVMAEILGRPLRAFENVHHLNGVRRDNRPENLELWTKPQPNGQRPEDLAAWVVEMYPEIVREILALTQKEPA